MRQIILPAVLAVAVGFGWAPSQAGASWLSEALHQLRADQPYYPDASGYYDGGYSAPDYYAAPSYYPAAPSYPSYYYPAPGYYAAPVYGYTAYPGYYWHGGGWGGHWHGHGGPWHGHGGHWGHGGYHRR